MAAGPAADVAAAQHMMASQPPGMSWANEFAGLRLRDGPPPG